MNLERSTAVCSQLPWAASLLSILLAGNYKKWFASQFPGHKLEMSFLYKVISLVHKKGVKF